VLDEGGLIASEFIEGVAAPVAMVGIAEKGYLGIALEIEAPGGHSSVPPRHTAIGDLSSAVVALESNPMPASLGGVTALFLDTLAPELGFRARVVLANRWLFGPLLPWAFSRLPVMDAMQRTTTAVTIFQSGVKENVLPTQARAVANFRIHPSDTVESVVDHVRDTIDDERIALQVGVRSPPQEPSPVSPVDSKGFTTLERTIRAVFPGTAVVPYLVLGGTDARHYQRLSDDVYRFLPFVFGPEALRLAHGSNERISIDNLAGGVRFYVRLLRAGAGAAAP
jgi:carboxypeptidase PM20D1